MSDDGLPRRQTARRPGEATTNRRSSSAKKADDNSNKSADHVGVAPDVSSPELDAELADAVGAALVVVLATRSPAERLAFVLHDMFDVSFEDIAPVLGRAPAVTKTLASRARRKVRGHRAWRGVGIGAGGVVRACLRRLAVGRLCGARAPAAS